MTTSIKIDPVTRIEGHLAINIEVNANVVTEAYSKGEMFRGFEMILKGRDPMDAQQITQRICGVCPVSHGMASILAQDQAYNISPPENGRLLRNLILGANYIQSHIVHFYHLSALDFVDITSVVEYTGTDPKLRNLKAWVKSRQASGEHFPAAPFLPRYEGRYLEGAENNLIAIRNYLEALEMRALAQKMGVLFAGKMPHVASLIPGGVTEKVSARKIAAFKSMLQTLQSFIDNQYLADVVAVATAFPEYFSIGRGPGNFLSYGVFPESDEGTDRLIPGGVLIDGRLQDFDVLKITEDAAFAFYQSDAPCRPDKGRTDPRPDKTGAYTWLKAPRYDGHAMEVGPLARMLVAYRKGRPTTVKPMVDRLLSRLNRSPADLNSTIGRHAARALECKLVADRCAQWIDMVTPGKPAFTDFSIPAASQGLGLTEAPRGALGHWLQIANHKISRYQCVVPTTWNCSPRDGRKVPGPVEQALVGTPIADGDHPIEAARVVRSFDPCIACAVH